MGRKSSITVHYMPPSANKNLYTVMIHGHSILTTLTKNPSVVTEWIHLVTKGSAAPRPVGFEIEIDVSTVRIGTLQLCVGNRCLIFQLFAPFPPALVQFLGDRNNTFLGSHLGSKIALLKARFPFEAAVQGRDLVATAPFLMDRKKIELGGVRDTNWDKFPFKLSVEQVHYACLHAFLNLHIWKPLSSANIQTLSTVSASITPHVGSESASKSSYDVIILGQTVWITVTTDPDAVQEWIDAVSSPLVGFEVERDVETRGIGTVQLFEANRCLVFQLLNTRRFPPFHDQFLENHVFVSSEHMAYNIDRLGARFAFSREKVRFIDMDDLTVAEASQKYNILMKLELGDDEKDWDRPSKLSDKQVHYASLDAFLNYHLAFVFGKIQ